MRPRAAALAVALLLVPLACEAPAPPAPKPKPSPPAQSAGLAIEAPPDRAPGGSPVAPATLPPARSCRQALSGKQDVDALPGQVDGSLVKGAEGLRKLRADWGNALVVLRGGDFSGQDLRGVPLHNLCFMITKFRGSDLRGASAPGIGFLHSDLVGARLAGARMRGILFSNSDLEDVDATGADFSNGSYDGSALAGWKNLRLDRADLRRFHFYCGRGQEDQCAPYWHPVSLRGADLRGARVETQWADSDWTGARLGWTWVNLRQLPALARARIEGPLLVREDKAEARLSPAEFAWLVRHISPSDGRSTADKPKRPGPARRLEPGRKVLFAALPVQFDSEARASPLFRRLLPAIVSGARSYVVVRMNRDRTVEVDGEAEGVNHHWCSVSGPPLRLDRATGWYSGPATGPLTTGRGWSGPNRPVLRLWEDKAEVDREGQPEPFNDYFQCGARAFFYEMTRIPFPAARAKRIWEAKQVG